MSDLDDLWGEALQEAYASAPAEEVVLSTLELRHTAFLDELGNVASIRLVNDPGEVVEYVDGPDPDITGLYLTLESDAPYNPGQTVLFRSVMFNFTLPAQRGRGVPELIIEIDNVASILVQYFDEAVKVRSPMEVIYREYLATDTTAPQFILPGLSIKTIESTGLRVTGTARFENFANKLFPNIVYRPNDFRGLMQ